MAKKIDYLEWYVSQLSSHIEAMVGIFFGLMATLFLLLDDRIITIHNTLITDWLPFLTPWNLILIMYILIGCIGVYFYIRTFYAHKMAEEFLYSSLNFEQYNSSLQKKVLEKSILFKLAIRLSEGTDGKYHLWFATLGGVAYATIFLLGLIAVKPEWFFAISLFIIDLIVIYCVVKKVCTLIN